MYLKERGNFEINKQHDVKLSFKNEGITYGNFPSDKIESNDVRASLL